MSITFVLFNKVVSSYSDLIITPSSASEYNEIVSHGTVFVEYVKNICSTCQFITRTYERLSNKYSNSGVKFLKVNTDELEEVKLSERINSVPVFIAYRNGGRVEKLLHPTEEQLEDFFNRWTKSIY